MRLKIFGGIAVVIGLFIAFVATRPSDFRVERSVSVSAPAAAVFAHVNEARKWEAWSPWQKLDPNMKTTYEGPEAGVGAVTAWVGNKEVGEGRSTITESRPDELVRFKLEMFKPMAAVNIVDFTFKPQGDQTIVTWSMNGESNFVCKTAGVFMDMDKMVGEQFEKGLVQLKEVSERKPG